MHNKSTIFIAGHAGLVGSAVYRNLLGHGYKNLIVISSDLHPEMESLSKIYLDNLCMGLQVIANENDFGFLENHLINQNTNR